MAVIWYSGLAAIIGGVGFGIYWLLSHLAWAS